MARSKLAVLGLFALLACGASEIPAAPLAEEPSSYLHFAGWQDHVELEKTQGCLELNKPFTIEMWCRWNLDVADNMVQMAGDETWPGMNPAVPVKKAGGWAMRLIQIRNTDKQYLQFNASAVNHGKEEWYSVDSPYLRINPEKWHHVAVCRDKAEIRLFWNGRLMGRRSCEGVTFLPSTTNIFLGVRKHAWMGRQFIGDIHACRLSKQALYSDHFTPTKMLSKDQSTLLLLDFNAADAETVPDISGHGRNGKITGAKWQKGTAGNPSN